MGHATRHRRSLFWLLAFVPLIAGCSNSATDLLSRDAEWFSRSGRLFIRSVSIDAPPLTPNSPIRPEDLVAADGGCAGMTPAGAQALTDGAAGAPAAAGGTVALGHTECDVVRGIGAPDSVDISNNPGGGRLVVVTWSRGPRAGIYTFSGGRLSSIERGPEPVAPERPAKKKKKAAT